MERSLHPHPEWIHTSTTFFAGRFRADLVRCNELTDGVALRTPDHAGYLVYAEDTDAVWLDLSAMTPQMPAVAVDTLQPYAEVDIGPLSTGTQTWIAPYPSDWALAVGTF